MDSIATRAPFAKASTAVPAASSKKSTPHHLTPNGIEIGSWTISQTLAPMSNTAETDAYVPFLSFLYRFQLEIMLD